ncbi:MAG TPA: thioredoxin domain-containing protein [Candidatus Saccharimonadales bacterium]|nr:thioredoxin domain-containing protein [Candidatus Saccharimonadales bacterium]
MNKIKWIIFAVFTIGILAVLIMTSGSSRIDVSNVDLSAIQTANSQDGNIADHVFGKVDSKVILIEYGDYQCSACGNINPSITAITEQYKNQLLFIFRNFPLTTIHPNTKAAAAAVEAAGLQGKYWEMHAKVYAGQTSWENLGGTERTDFFANYASELGLDTAKFKTDMASMSVSDKIDYDAALGKKTGLDSTPTFYLNGVKLDPTDWSNSTKLKDKINAELTKAGIALPK